jgi:demethylmenaquinone methyltransferase/2-methoxy-6-polyprenyl-1,4-benzoquinol methylase
MESTANSSSIRSMFNAIAGRYDLLNHLLSAGIDILWRRRAVDHLRDIHPRSVLDVGTGTADLAIAASRLSPARIVGVDIAEDMLDIGRRKVAKRGLSRMVELEVANAEFLPFNDNTFDAVTVAFGVRNFENLSTGLKEMCRVLRPGGKVVILEFSLPSRFPFRPTYLFYFRRVLPVIGRILSNHSRAYTYLPETVIRFPEGEDFLKSLRRAGFDSTVQERLTGGIATIYSGRKGHPGTLQGGFVG